MYVVAANFDGSGSLNYDRPELITGKEIRIAMPDWAPYIALSNAMTLSAKLTIGVPADLLENEFDARANLQTLRSTIRSAGELISADSLRLAQGALQRLQARENEPINNWAENLAGDISAKDD